MSRFLIILLAVWFTGILCIAAWFLYDVTHDPELACSWSGGTPIPTWNGGTPQCVYSAMPIVKK